MSIYGVRRRVACYVTRSTEGGRELLVFDHVDDDPDDPSGEQVPAGGMLPFEGIEDAALRESEEETGLTGLTFMAQLGAQERGLDDPGGPSMTTYVHLQAPDGGPDAWTHTVTSPTTADGSTPESWTDGADVASPPAQDSVAAEHADAGMVFACRWEPLPLTVELAGDQAEFLDALLGIDG